WSPDEVFSPIDSGSLSVREASPILDGSDDTDPCDSIVDSSILSAGQKKPGNMHFPAAKF
ncbi:hypothetical protein H4R20_006071, partial [Coemansia guatemalensis]